MLSVMLVPFQRISARGLALRNWGSLVLAPFSRLCRELGPSSRAETNQMLADAYFAPVKEIIHHLRARGPMFVLRLD
jgi:hypothetical protein